MFFNTFLNMACGLQSLEQSRNNNNRPNKKNDVITDLGGEGNFPMFLSGHPLFSDFRLVYLYLALEGSQLVLLQPNGRRLLPDAVEGVEGVARLVLHVCLHRQLRRLSSRHVDRQWRAPLGKDAARRARGRRSRARRRSTARRSTASRSSPSTRSSASNT